MVDCDDGVHFQGVDIGLCECEEVGPWMDAMWMRRSDSGTDPLLASMMGSFFSKGLIWRRKVLKYHWVWM